jgi:hypothetical protein
MTRAVTRLNLNGLFSFLCREREKGQGKFMFYLAGIATPLQAQDDKPEI